MILIRCLVKSDRPAAKQRPRMTAAHRSVLRNWWLRSWRLHGTAALARRSGGHAALPWACRRRRGRWRRLLPLAGFRHRGRENSGRDQPVALRRQGPSSAWLGHSTSTIFWEVRLYSTITSHTPALTPSLYGSRAGRGRLRAWAQPPPAIRRAAAASSSAWSNLGTLSAIEISNAAA